MWKVVFSSDNSDPRYTVYMSVGRGKGALNPCNLKFDAFLLNFQHKKLFASFRMSTMKFHHCWLIPGKIHNWPLLWKKPSDAHDWMLQAGGRMRIYLIVYVGNRLFYSCTVKGHNIIFLKNFFLGYTKNAYIINVESARLPTQLPSCRAKCWQRMHFAMSSD